MASSTRLLLSLTLGWAFTPVCPAADRTESEGLLPIGPSAYALAEPFTRTAFRQRIDALHRRQRFDGSHKEAKEVYSLLGVELGSDRATPRWRELTLRRSDLEQLKGYALRSGETPEKDYAPDASWSERRFTLVSERLPAIQVQMVDAESPQGARIGLLKSYRNTSMGLGPHVSRWIRIKDGAGEICLIAHVDYYGKGATFPYSPSKVVISDTAGVLFFRGSMAVELTPIQGGEEKASTKKPKSGDVMGLARQIDALLVKRLEAATNNRDTTPSGAQTADPRADRQR